MKQSETNHSIFYRHNNHDKCIYLIVYVDDIAITRDDHEGMVQLKQHIFSLSNKDLGKLKYFLGIEVAQSNTGIVIFQRKYVLDILKETGMLDRKPINMPMNPNVKLVPGQGESLSDPSQYRRLVGKLIFLSPDQTSIFQ